MYQLGQLLNRMRLRQIVPALRCKGVVFRFIALLRNRYREVLFLRSLSALEIKIIPWERQNSVKLLNRPCAITSRHKIVHRSFDVFFSHGREVGIVKLSNDCNRRLLIALQIVCFSLCVLLR